MWPIATDGAAWSVCISVCLLVMFENTAKMDEPIKMAFGWVTLVGPRNHVLDVVQICQGKGNFLGLPGFLRKSIVSHCCGVCSKKINNGISTAGVAGVILTFPRVKKSTVLQCCLLSKFFDHCFHICMYTDASPGVVSAMPA